MTVLTKFVRSGPRGWWMMLEAQWALIEARWLVKHRPTGQLAAPLTSESPSGDPAPDGLPQRIGELEMAVGRVGRYGLVRPSCLVSAIALQRLLNRHGFRDVAVHAGVRTRRGRFEAHAWVDWRGHRLDPSLQRTESFTPLAGVNGSRLP